MDKDKDLGAQNLGSPETKSLGSPETKSPIFLPSAICLYRNGTFELDVRSHFKSSVGQFVGSPLEILAEVAGRVCYDSYGKGRDSRGWHENIRAANHLSVYEHCYIDTYGAPSDDILARMVGLPGIYWNRDQERLTFNIRFGLEKHNDEYIGEYLRDAMVEHAPMLCLIWDITGTEHKDRSEVNREWVTFLLTCSRACSHEIVRHGDHTAISQRSTRYVDESASAHYLPPICSDMQIRVIYRKLQEQAKSDYASILELLETFQPDPDQSFNPKLVAYLDTLKGKAKKGFARYLMPHSLETQIVFSSSNWKHITDMRCSASADWEIQDLCGQVAAILWFVS